MAVFLVTSHYNRVQQGDSKILASL